MSAPKPSTPAAESAADIALRHVEAAQRELERACQSLCPVRGAAPDWRRLGKLCDRIEAEWHRLNKRALRGGLSLDSEPSP